MKKILALTLLSTLFYSTNSISAKDTRKSLLSVPEHIRHIKCRDFSQLYRGCSQSLLANRSILSNILGGDLKSAILRLKNESSCPHSCVTYIEGKLKKSKLPFTLEQFISLGFNESGFISDNVSSAGALGYYQLTKETAESHGYSPSDMFIPRENIDAIFKNFEKGLTYIKTRDPSANGEKLVNHLIAYHNGGSGALNDSKDCQGKLAYECKTNPGGLKETQNLITKVHKVASQIKDDSLL